MNKDLEIILENLVEIIYKNKKSTDLINEDSNKASNLSYIRRVVYGVLENKIYIDYMLGKLSKVKLKKIHKTVLTILEIGIYNLYFLDKKDYAIVNELVELTKKNNKKSSGFVNGILRNFIRNQVEVSTIKESDDYKSLSIRYSVPIEIIDYLKESYAYLYIKNFIKAINEESQISIRVNKLKTDLESLEKILSEKSYVLEKSKISPNALRVKNPSGLIKLKEFKEGQFSIQSEASMKVVEVLDPKKNSMILDLCAAPGSKTSYMAEFTRNESRIVANDISLNKNHLIEENIERLGLKNISITNYDASILVEDFLEKFDYVLCDLPCSGLGVMGRKPEIRYNRDIKNIESLAKLQRQILDKAVSYLKVGATLVYSTCTLGHLENIDNFSYLLSNEKLKNIQIDGKDYLEFENYKDRTDGFFISKFMKI
ncbi:MAG: 16S rRNA (cytosine(967)-C(5))-methyltransferase RsmB [Peptoniphilaceae bacterium]|nr:16S rRNA (cytosine(967)-C(5))-methyltransferase RsmB [Peptoniphilaceae bacterium]